MSSFPKVLIIDDDKALHKAISKALKKEDCDLLFADNGRRGLELVAGEAPILIFLDLLMPVMDGFEFLRRLRPKPEDPCTIVVISGHSMDTEIEKCYGLGADFFLKKPLSLVEVSCLVRQCMAMKKKELKRGQPIADLQQAAAAIKDMSRIIPICASCKKIQQSDGYWREVESFRHKYAHMDFTYSLCPACINTPYPDLKEE
jgi:CheY-like chemotaxis protein